MSIDVECDDRFHAIEVAGSIKAAIGNGSQIVVERPRPLVLKPNASRR